MRILERGTPMGVIKFVAEWLVKNDYNSIHKVGSSYFIIYFTIACLNSLLFVLLAFYGRGVFFSNLTSGEWQIFQNLLFIAAFASFFSYFTSLFKQLLTGAEEIAWLSKIDLLRKGLELFLILYIIAFPGSLSLIRYYLILQIFALLPLPLMVLKWGTRTSVLMTLFSGWHGRYFLPVLKYGLGIFAIEIFRVSFLQLRPVILQMRVVGEDAAQLVGYFGILLTITSIMNIAAGSLMTVLVPAFSRILTGDFPVSQRNLMFTSYTQKFTSVFLLPVSILIVVAPEFLHVYLGSDYVFLASYLQFWLIFSCLNIITTIYTSAIFAIGEIKQFFWFTFSNSLISTAIIWFLTPSLGLWAAVIGTSVYFLLKFFFFLLHFTPRILNLRMKDFLASISPATITAAIIILGGLLFTPYISRMDNLYLQILLVAILLTIAYVIFYFVFFIRNKRDFIHELRTKIRN